MLNEVDPAANRSTANGSTTVFPYTFQVTLKTDIEVLVDAVVKVVDTDYTVSGLGVSGGGNITFFAAPANNTVVTRLRKQPASQLSDYVPNEAFPSARIEADLDKLAMQIQQVRELASRSYHVPSTELGTAALSTIPSLALRANKYLAWDASGLPIAVDAASASGTSVTATGSTTARLLATHFADFVNVKNFGAIGNGGTDDTAAFTAAAAASGVGTHLNVTVPTGTYLLNSSPTLASKTVTWQLGAGVTFTGAGVLPGTKVLIGGPAPASTGLKDWYIDTSNPDSAAPFVWWQHIPATVNMTGGAAVQGVGLSFRGDTSAATPNAGLAETNMIRMDYTVNAAAGSKVQVHLINALLTVANDAGGSGNEDAGFLFTTRATGPTSGTGAVGIWGGDLHVEKATSVLDGSMVGLEVGVHKVPALSSAKCRGIDVWSGDRSGYTASRAGDAFYIHGDRGWTNFLKFIHTDETTEVWKVDQNGNLTILAPTGSLTELLQTNVTTTSTTLQLVGRDSGNNNVSGVMQASSGAELAIGTTTNHPVVIKTNNAEVFRIPAGTDGLLKTIAGLESTGATTATLGTASPATVTTPYKWIKMRSSDNTIVYFPVWK